MFDTIQSIDLQAFLALNGSWGAGGDSFFDLVSEKWAWIPLYLLILGLIWHRQGWRTMLVSLLLIGAAVGVTNELCDLLKEGVGRLRPSRTPELEPLVHIVDGYRGGRFGMPSAHAATTAAIAALSAGILRRGWLTVLLPLWVILVSYSRVYLGVHYPGDVLVGWAAGVAVAALFYRIFRLPILRGLYERGF